MICEHCKNVLTLRDSVNMRNTDWTTCCRSCRQTNKVKNLWWRKNQMQKIKYFWWCIKNDKRFVILKLIIAVPGSLFGLTGPLGLILSWGSLLIFYVAKSLLNH